MSRMVTDDLLVKCVAALRHIDGKTVAVVTSSESNAVTDYFHQQALDISSIHPGGRLATEHPEPPPQPVDLCCVEALSFQDFPEEVLLASVKPLLHDRLLLLLATRGNKSARTWESLVRAAQATGFK